MIPIASTGTAFVDVKPNLDGFQREMSGSKLSGIGKKAGVALAAGVGLGLVALGKIVKDSLGAAQEAVEAEAQTAAVLKSTGQAAGVTEKHISDLTTRIMGYSAISDEAVREGTNLLLTFCLEESAEALTKDRGWVSHKELSEGEPILSYDPETGEALWEPITSMHRFDVNGDLIRWKSKQIDVATTPHHRWWTTGRTNGGYQDYRFRTTEEVSGHQFRVMIGGGSPSGFAPEQTISDELVELLGWVMTEGWFVPWKDQSKKRKPRLCAVCGERTARNLAGPARCDECSLGPIQNGRTTPREKVTAATSLSSGIGFCQSLTANPEKVERIRQMVRVLQDQGHRISETSRTQPYNGSTVVSWHFAGPLGRMVRALLPDKNLTPELFGLFTAKQAERFLDVLIAADGHTDSHGHRSFIQKDRSQLDLVAMLCAMLGIRTTIGKRADQLILTTTNHAWGTQLNATQEHYEGVVWCPHLRTGIFMARNNGRTFWTGNTNIRNEAGKGNDIFDQTAEIMTDMSVAMGTDAKGSAIQLGKALNDPVKGISALSRVGVTFTEQTKEQITALVESGDTMAAQKIILAELKKEFGGSAKAVGDTKPWDKFKNAVGEVQESIGKALLPTINDLADRLNKFTRSKEFQEWVQDASRWLEKEFPKAVDKAVRYGKILIDNAELIGKSIGGVFTAGLAVRVASLATGLLGIGKSSTGAAKGLGGLAGAGGPLAAATAGFAALYLVVKKITGEDPLSHTLAGVDENKLKTLFEAASGTNVAPEKVTKRVAELTDKLNAYGGGLSKVQEETIAANIEAGHYESALKNLNRYVREGIDEEFKHANSLGSKARKELEAKEASNQHRLAMIASGNTMDATGGKSDSLKTKVGGLGDSIRNLPSSKSITIRADTTQASAALDSLIAKLGRIIGGVFEVDPPDRRARGGPVSANTPYIVGEEGPELFRPHSSGTILNANRTRQLASNGRGGPSGATFVTINQEIIGVQDPEEVADIAAFKVAQVFRSAGIRAMGV